MKTPLTLLLISLWLISHHSRAGTRDPFQPGQSPCTAGWQHWHYQGIIEQSPRQRALLRTDQDQWLRLSQGDALPGGGQLLQLSAHSLTLSAGENCPPVTLPLRHKD